MNHSIRSASADHPYSDCSAADERTALAGLLLVTLFAVVAVVTTAAAVLGTVAR